MTRRGRRAVRLRLVPYFLVLALPLAVGTWAFGNFAADNARDRADARLQGSLGAAAAAFGTLLADAETQAHALAGSRRVQRAILAKDRRTLGRIARATPHAAFFAGGRRLAGAVPADAPRRSVAITVGRRIVGRVVVSQPLDDAALARLATAANLTRGDRLVATQGDSVVAGAAKGARVGKQAATDVKIHGVAYRAVSVPIVRGRAVRLAVLTPRARLAASEARARRRVLLAGLAVLAGVGLAAYALAPVFARTRVAQQQRAQAAQILSHVGDGVFLVDPAGEIRFWNPAAEAITGLSGAEAIGRRPETVFRKWAENAPTPAAAAPGERFGAAVAQTARYDVEARELWLSISAVEAPSGTIYAFRDLTEEFRLEEARADFVATVSHELRTPLSSIHGAAHTLRERDPDLAKGTRRQLHEIVYEQSARLAHLVDQILLANQLSSGAVHVEKRRFDPVPVARAAIEEIRPVLPPQVDVDVHTAPSLPAVVGDPDRTRQVLVNLIENAGKYSPGGGRVDVVIGRTDGHVRFSVHDEGLGIPPNEHARIFEKFYRLDPSMTRGVGGSGLGLFISQELVSLMDGRLRVKSQPAVGSTFWFELRCAEGE